MSVNKVFGSEPKVIIKLCNVASVGINVIELQKLNIYCIVQDHVCAYHSWYFEPLFRTDIYWSCNVFGQHEISTPSSDF